MPDAPCPQSPPISLQHCLSSAVSCASRTAQAMIGPPKRRTTSNNRKWIASFISCPVHLGKGGPRTLDTITQQRFQTKAGWYREHALRCSGMAKITQIRAIFQPTKCDLLYDLRCVWRPRVLVSYCKTYSASAPPAWPTSGRSTIRKRSTLMS